MWTLSLGKFVCEFEDPSLPKTREFNNHVCIRSFASLQIELYSLPAKTAHPTALKKLARSWCPSHYVLRKLQKCLGGSFDSSQYSELFTCHGLVKYEWESNLIFEDYFTEFVGTLYLCLWEMKAVWSIELPGSSLGEGTISILWLSVWTKTRLCLPSLWTEPSSFCNKSCSNSTNLWTCDR